MQGQSSVVSRILTSNWKDGAYAGGNSVSKQLMAMMMILGQLYLGGQLVAEGDNSALGAMTVAYGGASLVGYFNFEGIPIAKFARVNMMSLIAGLLAGGSMLTSGFSLPLFFLFMSFMQDTFMAATDDQEPVLGQERSAEEVDRDMTSVESFLVTSWKNGTFADTQADTKQLVQMVLMMS